MARPAIDYTPKHPQPVTLAQLRQLEPELLSNEITRLQNSIQHLERSNVELREFAGEGAGGEGGEEDEVDEESKAEFEAAIRENEETIAAQTERLHMIRLALEEQVGVDAGNPHYNLAPLPSSAAATASAVPAPSSTTTTQRAGETNGPTDGREGEEEVMGVQGAAASRGGGEDDGMYL